ncbi:MAG TPA: rhodanese-like domain-containing protein [Thermoanaerobaculia bacterium]|nr:rhodanese-like domain-containing protein [Thermoanaerobaculia bacterium]
MEFHQFYLPCLAHASYLVGEGGECAIVDPQRDVDHYIDEAARRGLTIRYVIETHLHADFVSGHRELAARTGADIVIGAASDAGFPHRAVRDGDALRLGSIELRAIETPGHTPESVCWLVVEEGSPSKLLTGDTLFIGDVGRPDLAGGRGYTSEQMASMLYDSLHGKILTLPDDVEVWPAHGAGSACGRNISKETSSTIGIQRRVNDALRPMPRHEFVKMLTTDLPEAPRYFPMDAEINRRGARPLAEIEAPPLQPRRAKELIESGAVPLDVRDPAAFGAGHLRGAVNVGLRGQFASWCGTLLSPLAPVVIIADDPAGAAEAVMRLARVGLENATGWLEGGVDAWRRAGLDCATLPQLPPSELRERLGSLRVVDVRNPGEYAGGHVPGAQNVPLAALDRRLGSIERAATAVICASGYRSSIAASLLERHGMEPLFNVAGGTSAWVREGFATE